MLKSIAAGAGTGLLYSTAGCTGGGGGDGGDGGDGGGDGGDGGDGGGGDGGGGQTTQTQEGPIKVGGVFPLSGPYSPLGKPQKAGLELTAEVINGEGGILGRNVETYIEDSQTEPQAGKQAARKLMESEDVDMIFGPVSSAVAVLIQDYLADKNVIFHAGNAINHMTEEGCEPNTFRWETNNTIFANVGAKWAVENLGKNVWVHFADYNWGQEITQEFKDEFDEIGGVNIVGETKSQLGTKDFSTYISQMSASDADWALQNMVGGDAIVFLKQMAEFGLKEQMDVFGANNAFLPVRAASGAASIGTYTPVPYYEGFQSELNTRIRNLFLEKTERVPDEFQVAIWVGLHATASAIEEAGSTDRSEVIPALEGLRFQAPVGSEAYYRKCDHQGYRPVSVAEIVEGEKIPALDIKSEIPADQAMDPCSEIPCDM